MLFDDSKIAIKRTEILSIFSNIDYFHLPKGNKLTGQFLVAKDSNSFLLRWKSKKSIWKLFSNQKSEYDQIIKASEISSIILEIDDNYSQLYLFRNGENDPFIWKTNQNHFLFAQELIQDFSLYSIFLSNPNWGSLIKLVSHLPDPKSLPLIILFPCYQSQFSYPSFLDKNSLFNEETESYCHDFPQIRSQYNLSNKFKFPLTHSEFSLLYANGKSIGEISELVQIRGLSQDLRSVLWPVYLSILPSPIQLYSNQDEIDHNQKVYESRIIEYSNLKYQWESLSPYQLLQWKSINSAFYTITIDVKRTAIPDTLLTKIDNSDVVLLNKISFLFKFALVNILKTYAIWNYKIRYTQGINELAVPFATSTVYQVINDLISMHQNSKQNEQQLRDIFSEINREFGQEAVVEDCLIEINDDDLDDRNSLIIDHPFNIDQTVDVKHANHVDRNKKANSASNENQQIVNLNNDNNIDSYINSNDFKSSFAELPEMVLEYATIEQVFDNDLLLIQKFKESEAISFWCFASFLERSQSVLLETTMDNLVEHDMPTILEIIHSQSPETYQFIKDSQHDNMQFYVSSVMLLFRRSFNESKVERIWDSIIAVGENDTTISLIRKKNFEYAFSAAVLIFAVPLLKRYVQCSESKESDNEKFLLNIHEMINQIPVDMVIEVALSIEREMPHPVPQSIAINNFQDNFQNVFFTPSMNNETQLYKSNRLFF